MFWGVSLALSGYEGPLLLVPAACQALGGAASVGWLAATGEWGPRLGVLSLCLAALAAFEGFSIARPSAALGLPLVLSRAGVHSFLFAVQRRALRRPVV